MSIRTKRLEVEIEGQETVRCVRTAILEIPEDMTDEEIECVNADHFN